MNIRLPFTVGHHGYRWQTDEWLFVLAKVVEDLPFIHDREVSGQFNRQTHQFNYRALLTAIEREEAREGVAIRKVSSAYPSTIGRFKYHPRYGIIAHHAATLVIGRRGGLKVRRENVSKALRQYTRTQHPGDDVAYPRRIGAPGLRFNGSCQGRWHRVIRI